MRTSIKKSKATYDKAPESSKTAPDVPEDEYYRGDKQKRGGRGWEGKTRNSSPEEGESFTNIPFNTIKD